MLREIIEALIELYEVLMMLRAARRKGGRITYGAVAVGINEAVCDVRC